MENASASQNSRSSTGGTPVQDLGPEQGQSSAEAKANSRAPNLAASEAEHANTWN